MYVAGVCQSVILLSNHKYIPCIRFNYNIAPESPKTDRCQNLPSHKIGVISNISVYKCELVDRVEEFEKMFNINTIRTEACPVGTIRLKILFIPPP
jgi:hypothetical protein